MMANNLEKKICFVMLIVFYVATFSYAEDDSARKVLKQGLVGAGSGALAAQMSGGKAGQGALIGAGTSVVGGALLDTITQPQQPQKRYIKKKPPAKPAIQKIIPDTEGGRKKIIRKYDDTGKVVSEEEIYY